MIPRVSKPGRSFKGAVTYYAHDKGAATSDRLGFVELVNLPVLASEDKARDLERAAAIMAWTAMHQDDLRRLHHHKASPGTPYRPGRKLSNSVYSFSLRFAPEDAHRVDAALLKNAAHGALKVLGMDQCQATIIQHRDSIPSHVHVLVNLVDPKTGRTVSRSRDFFKLSTFAQKFTREHGLHIITQREENNARRKRGEIVKHKEVPRAEWELMRGYRGKSEAKVERERRAQQEADRAQLAERQRRAIERFNGHLMTTYGADRLRIDARIDMLKAKVSQRTHFSQVTQLYRRLTGRDAALVEDIRQLRKTRASIDTRISELRTPLAHQLRDERIRLANRHAAELLRDAEYFAARARSRSDGDSFAAEIARATFAAKAQQQARATPSADAHAEHIRKATPEVSEDTAPREKRWSRATGRDPDRPHRPRRRGPKR
ncbi:MAG: hypothetical protein BGN89_07780 [Alphaproteobacteria bacterium 64-6]|jgi:hypothetical protein|nr:relaxase/mobilization nuclease domain-containing protein [Hyphomicrobium sp.]MBN9265864.1 relaxase/mobilization nuclease domain-containing protein [Hyphomicrobium sp.]OJU28801.1 MAG: hypothetical protein BGN89_07780 [Alphaproteobacteria bacterium 64-6]